MNNGKELENAYARFPRLRRERSSLTLEIKVFSSEKSFPEPS